MLNINLSIKIKLSYKELEKNSKKFLKDINNESGQTFVEFVLLLVVISTISYTFMAGVNSGLAKIWKKYIQLICPSETDLTM